MDMTPVIQNCDRYNKCVDGTNLVTLFCPSGLFYDNVRLGCYPPSAAKGLCGAINGYRNLIIFS